MAVDGARHRPGSRGRRGPLPGDRVPDIDCARADDGGRTTLHAEIGDKWALVMPGPMVADEHADRWLTALTRHGRTAWASSTPRKASP
ncbi:MAG: hypothetical protein ACRD2C_18840 [Acidimicrobiales bacterium]